MEWLVSLGYLGLFLGSFAAATVLPFSADAMLVAMLALDFDPVISIIVATLGNFLGGLTCYGLGWLGKWEWIEKLGVKEETLLKQKQKIDKWGPIAALLCWVPIIGDVIAVALGFYRAPFWLSALYMFIGKAARFVVWALLFYAFSATLI